MRVVSVAAGKFANSRGESPCRKNEAPLQTNSIVMRVARSLWPSKAIIRIAEITGASERMCQYWLANRYSLSANDVAAFLRSDDGLQFLEAIMGEAKPVWWKRMKRSAERAALRRSQRELQRQIDQIELDLD